MYEPITVEIDRGCSEGDYRSYTIDFFGRLVRIVEDGHITMRLYEWAGRGRLLYLVHVEEDKPGRPPRRTLYPFINTHVVFGTVWRTPQNPRFTYGIVFQNLFQNQRPDTHQCWRVLKLAPLEHRPSFPRRIIYKAGGAAVSISMCAHTSTAAP